MEPEDPGRTCTHLAYELIDLHFDYRQHLLSAPEILLLIRNSSGRTAYLTCMLYSLYRTQINTFYSIRNISNVKLSNSPSSPPELLGTGSPTFFLQGSHNYLWGLWDALWEGKIEMSIVFTISFCCRISTLTLERVSKSPIGKAQFNILQVHRSGQPVIGHILLGPSSAGFVGVFSY